jgi:hypothetical protein
MQRELVKSRLNTTYNNMGFVRQKQKIMKSNDKGHTFLKWLNLTTGRISLRKIPQNVLRKDAPTTKKKKFQQTIVFYSSSQNSNLEFCGGIRFPLSCACVCTSTKK